MTYAYEDRLVGYIQGMNMILSGLLYHIKEEIKTYAVFRKVIFTMRSIYLDSTPSIIKILVNAMSISAK
jgi:hypothetical protein